MKAKLTAHIEHNGGRLYSIYVNENLPFGIIGEGYTKEEAIQNFLEVYRQSRAAHRQRTGNDEDYTFHFVLDPSAALAITKDKTTLAAIAQKTGINKVQLSQYACGRRTPTPRLVQRIKQGIEDIAAELNAIAADMP